MIEQQGYEYVKGPDGQYSLPEQMLGRLIRIGRFPYGTQDWEGYELTLDSGVVIDLPASAGQITIRQVRVGDIMELTVSEWQQGTARHRDPRSRDITVIHGDQEVARFITSVDFISLV